MRSRIPPELERLLDTLLDTYEKVEVVGHLAGERSLTAEQLCARAHLPPEVLEATLARLQEVQVVEIETAGSTRVVSLGPRARMPDFEELLRIHGSDPLAILSASMSLSISRVRAMAARTFADAFLLRSKRRRDDA